MVKIFVQSVNSTPRHTLESGMGNTLLTALMGHLLRYLTSLPHHTSAFCGASISELDNEQWKADTAVDEAIDGNDSDNMTSNEATTSQNESHETPEKPERMDETMLPEGEMIKCFKRIMVSQYFVSLPDSQFKLTPLSR